MFPRWVPLPYKVGCVSVCTFKVNVPIILKKKKKQCSRPTDLATLVSLQKIMVSDERWRDKNVRAESKQGHNEGIKAQLRLTEAYKQLE